MLGSVKRFETASVINGVIYSTLNKKSELKPLDILARWCSNNLMYKSDEPETTTTTPGSHRIVIQNTQTHAKTSVWQTNW